MYLGQVDAVWVEAARFRVRDEKGTIHIVVEMRDEPSDLETRRGHAGFYFLLDGQDVRRASEDAFVNLSTGEFWCALPIDRGLVEPASVPSASRLRQFARSVKVSR